METEIEAAMAVMDGFMEAFNAEDLAAGQLTPLLHADDFALAQNAPLLALKLAPGAHRARSHGHQIGPDLRHRRDSGRGCGCGSGRGCVALRLRLPSAMILQAHIVHLSRSFWSGWLWLNLHLVRNVIRIG